MVSRFILPLSLVMMGMGPVRAESSPELAAIERTARTYMQSWYQGDADGMRASLHKKLAKRSLKGLFGEPDVRHTTASAMIRYTENGYGTTLGQKGQSIEVVVLDAHANIASVKVVTPHYYEYLHLAKIEGC